MKAKTIIYICSKGASGLRGNDGNGKRKRTTETENGNGKRTGLEWTGLTKNSVNAFFSVGQKLAYLFIH